MLNDFTIIKNSWPGDALNIDDSRIVRDGKTAYDLYLENESEQVAMRLKRWVGESAYDDAEIETPADANRADALRHAELELIHVQIMEKMWRDRCAGVERDIQLPSGTRITLQAFSGDDCRNIISAHLVKAELYVMEYIS